MIRKLPSHIVHQIAAGEVVERPASALKELIENALDAKASKVVIEYEAGGLKRLIVEDNGRGMSEEDLPLAFEPHSTSKLKDLDDFKTLSSFGFRGEALCSLAAVADVEIWTSTLDSAIGFRARSAYGEFSGVESADKRMGTRIQIKDLFSRIPARLKFMKTERGEAQALSQVFRRYALSDEKTAWIFREIGGKKEIRLPAQSLLERWLWFFDAAVPDSCFDAESQDADWKVRVIALRPRFQGREIRSGIFLYLNGRPFRDSKMEFALRRGFEGFTENTRDISAAVFIEGSPELFDVNVHPMKSEIRFIQPDRLFSTIVKAVRTGLDREHHSYQEKGLESVSEFRSPTFPPSVSTRFERTMNVRESANLFDRKETMTQASSDTSPREEFVSVSQAKVFVEVSEFEYLGSIDNTYLVTKRNEELFLFDQHALHERILYERLLHDFKTGAKILSQRLLFPIPVAIAGAEVLLEQEEVLERLGFELRLWNDRKIQIVAAPSILKRDYASVLSKLSESLAEPIETMARDVLATMACHSAVRAHDRLERAEIEKLLKDFEAKDALGHCPHGRPTFVRFQNRDLEKIFHRIL